MQDTYTVTIQNADGTDGDTYDQVVSWDLRGTWLVLTQDDGQIYLLQPDPTQTVRMTPDPS